MICMSSHLTRRFRSASARRAPGFFGSNPGAAAATKKPLNAAARDLAFMASRSTQQRRQLLYCPPNVAVEAAVMRGGSL
jgi:hypothetical protein